MKFITKQKQKQTLTPDCLVQTVTPQVTSCEVGQVSSLPCLRTFALAVLGQEHPSCR